MANKDFVTLNNMSVRENATDGLWVLFILPLALILSAITHPVVLTTAYQLMLVLTIGIFLRTFIILLTYRRDFKIHILDFWSLVCLTFTSSIFHVTLNRGWEFSIISGIFASLIFPQLYLFLMLKFENTFSIGEGGLLAQALTMFLYGIVTTIVDFDGTFKRSNMQIATAIIQFGLFGLLTVATAAYFFQVRSPAKFYFLLTLVVFFEILLPLHIFIEGGPLLWIFIQLFKSQTSILLILFWCFCMGCNTLVLNFQISRAKKASTSRRKIFHFIMVAIFLPGLFYQCSLLYLATGVALGLLFFFDMLRILQIPPLATYLQDGFIVFKDEKDGALALTPIYLFAGCSLPLWIHPAPCDVTDSAMFSILPLISGLLSVGIGDAVASYFGSKFGRIHWPKSKKTLEGTIASILSQTACIYAMHYFGAIPVLSQQEIIKASAAIFLTSCVEAKTSQVDNLVLPFIMYLILV